MKLRISILCSLIIVIMLLIGCDTSKKHNVVIYSDEGWYINTSESVSVTSYNKYRLVDSEKIENEDGSITVTLKFDKPIK